MDKIEQVQRKATFYTRDKGSNRIWKQIEYNNKFITKYFGITRSSIIEDFLLKKYTPQGLRDFGYISNTKYNEFMTKVKNGDIKLSKEALKNL